tara:strand:+ start:7549 stop:7695 length:147 start_codon:yes stop_codon:yes gene_type:complete
MEKQIKITNTMSSTLADCTSKNTTKTSQRVCLPTHRADDRNNTRYLIE